MRLASLYLAAAIWVAVSASLTGESWAQQTHTEEQPRTADLAAIYAHWQQTQDPDQKITLGEQLAALEPAFTSWPLSEPRNRVKAELWFGLGSAYVVRASGIRADNLDKAVTYLEAALKVFTREADPQNWAATANNLGNAYQARVRGERADNQERAIAHFEAALGVFSREAYPLQWAQLQNNLGIVYWNRIRERRAENLEDAIMHLEAALTVFTHEAHPQLWAAASNNLGSIYQARVRGDRGDNREKAIAHVKAALTVFSRDATPREWAQAQNNLAAIYLSRIREKRADNQEQAISHLASAATVFTRDAFPQEWATVQRGVGNAYADRVRGNRAGNRETAIGAYEAALTVFTREASPLEHLRTVRRLGRVLLQSGQWDKASLVLAGGRDAFLILFGQGLEDAEARALIAEAGPLFAEAAFVTAERGDRETALEIANEGRARLLAVAMKLQALELSSDERARLADLRAAIRAGQQAADAVHGSLRQQALDRLASLRQELLRLVAHSDRSPGKISALAQARAIIAAGDVIAIPVVTEFGTKLLVVTKTAVNGKNIISIDLPKLTTDRLAQLLIGHEDNPTSGWIDAYFVNYLEGAERNKRWSEWTGAIDRLGPELWRLFGARLDATLKQHGIKTGARLVWLPSGWLGVLPLGLAQNTASKRRLADDYEIVYAPSIEALVAAKNQIKKAGAPALAAVINPTGDLPGAEKEGILVASHFTREARAVLERDAATLDAVLAALQGKSYWHFASHGTFSWEDARQSALVMHGHTMLSVGRLLETGGLGRPRLVVLSACETGLSDITTSPDEFIGLPGTFTALGAAGVLGTLWPVSDAATTLLIAKFYEMHMAARLPPPTALRRAQAWLRNATSEELGAYAGAAVAQGRLQRHHLTEIKAALSLEDTGRSHNGSRVERKTRTSPTSRTASKQLARPYAHPYFWGGFVYSGL